VGLPDILVMSSSSRGNSQVKRRLRVKIVVLEALYDVVGGWRWMVDGEWRMVNGGW